MSKRSRRSYFWLTLAVRMAIYATVSLLLWQVAHVNVLVAVTIGTVAGHITTRMIAR